jgi:hypothetical protein
MSLVNFDESNPPYIVISPSANVDLPISNNFFYFQNLVASQRITKTSNTRITFQESGVYEFNFGFRNIINTGWPAFTFSWQYGINGSWVTFASGSSASSISTPEGRNGFILSINANDYFELRSSVSVGVSQNSTYLCVGNTNATSTIKRIH